MIFNILLGNHDLTPDNLGGLSKLTQYMEMVLGQCGHEVVVSLQDMRADGINLIFENFLHEKFRSDITALKQAHDLKIGVIATELIVDGKMPYARSGFSRPENIIEERTRQCALMLEKLDFVWCFLKRTVDSYSTIAKICHFFPIGSIAEQAPDYLKSPKDIDVVFFGKATPFRSQIIEAIRQLGINIFAFGAGFPSGHIDEYLLGNILRRTKVGLSLSFEKYDGPEQGVDPRFASCFRVKQMLDSGVCIVSETMPFDNPYAPYMVSCAPDQIAAQVQQLLTNGQWDTLGREFAQKFKTEMSASALCRPVIDATLKAMNACKF